MEDNEEILATEWWTKLNTEVLVLMLANVRILKVIVADCTVYTFKFTLEKSF